MATSGGDAQVKELNRIWNEWGLEPDVTLGKAQQEALGVVAGWLEKGMYDPEIVIRATQILLLDAERTDRKRRPCWGILRDELVGTWSNAGSGADHLLYVQALLLATWPTNDQGGWHALAALMDSSWVAARGRNQQALAIAMWRQIACTVEDLNKHELTGAHGVGHITDHTPTNLPSDNTINTVKDYVSNGHVLINTFKEVKSAIVHIDSALGTMIQGTNANLELVNRSLQHIASQLPHSTPNAADLLWWGQARYCKAERKPYRRLPCQDDVLWWAPREAAELSRALEIEPAASYVVETLTSLGHDSFEKKPLRQWMAELHDTLSRARNKTPPVSESLKQIASVDALGLPVTWVRLKAASKDNLEGADDAIALALDTEIDRGEWASWIFRETLLDLRLSEGA